MLICFSLVVTQAKPDMQNRIYTFDIILTSFMDLQVDFMTTDLVNFLENFNPYKHLSIVLLHWQDSAELENIYDIPLMIFTILSYYHTWLQTEVQFFFVKHSLWLVSKINTYITESSDIFYNSSCTS